jgi:serine protease Do
MTIVRDSCFRCGEWVPQDAVVCQHCAGSLLVDVKIETTSQLQPRELYQVARELALLGRQVPAFQDLKRSIEQAPGTVIPQVTRALADRAVPVLERHDLPVMVAPTQIEVEPALPMPLPRARSRFSSWLVPILVGFGLMIAGIIAYTMLPRPEIEVPNLFARTYSTSELAKIATLSSVQLRCSETQGAGFFVDSETVITNAHVLCDDSDEIEVVLAGGRTLQGQPVRRDKWLDLAAIKVPGAAAQGIEIGDATLLELGEKVVIIGSPLGMEFTIAEGIVSHTSRNMMGVAYLQIDAGVHHGNSGGPVLDSSGKVVGIVTMMVGSSSNLGLAVPANYLSAGSEPFLQRDRLASEINRWNKVLGRASRLDKEEVKEVRAAMHKPSLVASFVNPAGEACAIVVRHGKTIPRPETFDFNISAGEQSLCDSQGEVIFWKHMGQDQPDAHQTRYIMWLRRHRLVEKLYTGMALLDLEECPHASAIVGAKITLNGADPRADHAKVTMMRP